MMDIHKNKPIWIYLSIVLVLGTILLTSCENGDDDSDNVLQDVVLQLAPGACASTTFSGQAGVSVNIRATGPSNEDPNLFVTDPTGAQVATAQTTTLGVETLGLTPSVTGAFTLSVCDANNVGGPVRVIITQ